VQRALAEAKQRLQDTYGDRLRRVILYGSRARGDATPESDVDLLVVLEGPIENSYQEIKRAGAFWGEFLTRYGLSFSVKPYTEETYQDMRRPFMRNVHADGIEL
jgi:predicted nucleotidyltransferase